MENGSWNFFEQRKTNISDISQKIDLLIVLFVSSSKIFLYSKIYKRVSKTFNLATLRDSDKRKKFKKVGRDPKCNKSNKNTFFKASFMSLWANVLEVILETLIVVVILISYGMVTINNPSYIKRPGIGF